MKFKLWIKSSTYILCLLWIEHWSMYYVIMIWCSLPSLEFTLVLISGISTMVNVAKTLDLPSSTMVNGTLLNFGKRYKDDFKGHFWSVAKVALRFRCTKQSKNLKRYLTQSLFWPFSGLWNSLKPLLPLLIIKLGLNHHLTAI